MNKARAGRVADIVRLDFHDHWGRMFDRTRCKTTEKMKGILMIQKIMNYFDITIEDYQKRAEEELIKEAYEQRNIDTKQVKWNRDERGNIISPFSSKISKD